LQHLVSGAAQGSAQSLIQLIAFVKTHPLAKDQLENLLPKLLTHLDRRKISRGEKPLAFDIPILSLRCLVPLVFKNYYRQNPLPKVHHILTAFWPHLWKWLEAICSRYIHNAAVDLDDRITAKSAVLSIVLFFSDESSLRTLPESNPGVIPLVLKLWALEATKAESKSFRSPAISASMVLERCFVSFYGKTRLNWIETILTPLGGSAKDVASIGLAHIRHHSPREQPDIVQVGIDINVVIFLSNYNPIGYAFQSQHSVPALTRVLGGLALRSYSQATSSEVAICMNHCFAYLCGAFRSGNSCTWIVQSLDEQLICAMLRCSAWHKDLDKHFTLLLSHILPKNLVLRSVVLAMRSALKQVRAKGLFLDIGDGQLGKNWAQLKELTEERIALIKSEDNEPYLVGSSPICHNTKVS
jgi:hypothetical protein